MLRLVNDVLEALDCGTDARNHLCAGVAELFECAAIGHAYVDGVQPFWSVCLWRAAREGARSLVLAGDHDVPGARDAEWTASTCRRVTLDWMVMPYLAELPLTRETSRFSVLVLGRDRPFGLEDTRRVDSALHPLTLVEHVVLRLEPPRPPGAALPRASVSLTDREMDVLALLAQGLLARSIAQRLLVSERTVHKHLGNLYRKLGVHDRLLAVSRGRELGLLPATDEPRTGGW